MKDFSVGVGTVLVYFVSRVIIYSAVHNQSTFELGLFFFYVSDFSILVYQL